MGSEPLDNKAKFSSLKNQMDGKNIKPLYDISKWSEITSH